MIQGSEFHLNMAVLLSSYTFINTIDHAIPVYQGYASQYGHGLGNVLGGLIRSAMLFMGKVGKVAGTKLLETGLHYVSNNLKKKKPSPCPHYKEN